MVNMAFGDSSNVDDYVDLGQKGRQPRSGICRSERVWNLSGCVCLLIHIELRRK